MAIDPNAKGWLMVPGIRPDGDRTLEEQMMGLTPALEECRGKTVLDLGAAEGLIGREFARAGAVSVLGIELLETHLEVARKACAGYPQMRFICSNLLTYILRLAGQKPQQFDLVLCLGVIHKMPDPSIPLRFAAQSARSLLVFRAPAAAIDGVVKSKYSGGKVNVPQVMREEGFVEEALIQGVRGEAAQYWRRARSA